MEVFWVTPAPDISLRFVCIGNEDSVHAAYDDGKPLTILRYPIFNIDKFSQSVTIMDNFIALHQRNQHDEVQELVGEVQENL